MTTQDSRPIVPLWPLIGFAAAALFGFVVLPLVAKGPFSELTGNSAYRTMQVLYVLQASLWIFGAAYTIGLWRRVPATRSLPRSSQFAILLVGVLTVLPYVFFYRSTTGHDFFQSKVSAKGIASGLGALAGMIVGAGIVRIHTQANNLLSGSEPHVTAFRELSSHLERHVLLLGAILAGAVLGSRASQLAIISVDHKTPPYGPEHVWQLAIYWSALLSVVYAGARSSVRRIGYRLRDSLMATAGSDDEDTDRLQREEDVGKSLGLNRSYIEELQSVLNVLTPIAAAVASKLLDRPPS